MRKALALMALVCLLAVSTVSATAVTPSVSAPAADGAHGARACFGIGTNNCCGEFMVVGVLSAETGNVLALALSVGAMYVYCY